jgi:hypothetical protein
MTEVWCTFGGQRMRARGFLYHNRHFDFCGIGGGAQSFLRNSSSAVRLSSESFKAASVCELSSLKPVMGVGWFVIPFSLLPESRPDRTH